MFGCAGQVDAAAYFGFHVGLKVNMYHSPEFSRARPVWPSLNAARRAAADACRCKKKPTRDAQEDPVTLIMRKIEDFNRRADALHAHVQANGAGQPDDIDQRLEEAR
jgi:hypothetical protein